MRKTLLLIFAFLFSTSAFSQLDTDHWFAPMAARAGVSGYEGALYLSTKEMNPMTVQIFNNNILFQTVTISKGNPGVVQIPQNMMIAATQSELFTSGTKGLNLKSTKKFYASYRFAVTSHAEIITSKGLAGLGKTFYAAMAPLSTGNNITNASIGIVATEDNTTVTVSGYSPGVIFSDGTSPATKTFTLNRGKSYILETRSNATAANLDGLIGAKIVADKGISVTNGNFNAIYTAFNFTNNDIIMDQAVPTDRLGKEFAVVIGNGSYDSGMEAVLAVATENGTQLTVNGVPYGSVMNEGDYVVIPGTSYIDHGNGQLNMSVNGNKNIYIYQLLAGTSIGNEYAAGGFNYIPPLSCFLPNEINEIGNIDQMGATTYQTKLNILTQAGATVTVNGSTPPAGSGPYPLTGNTQWVTYSLFNVTGNITVISSKAVTAGIAAGSGAVGYGGYFAGFSSVPVISKSGDCYNGILLQVDNTYDGYQWYFNGNPIAGATSYSINPVLYGAGNYTVMVTKNNCETKLTEVFQYTECPPITTVTVNLGSCNSTVINPSFTTSSQTINIPKTAIVGYPLSGTAVLNTATGTITYTPNAGLTTDTVDNIGVYIEGNGTPADFEYIKYVIQIDVLQTTNTSLTVCSETSGSGNFDLTTATVTPDAGTTVTFYTDAALTNQITIPTAYSSTGGVVYAKVTSQYGCSKPAQITLIVNPKPNINTSNFNAAICDENLDGNIPVDFSTVTPQIIANSAAMNVRYYLVQADATAGNANNLPNNWTYNAATTVYVRVDPLTGNCPPAFGQLNFTIGTKISLLTTDYTAIVCDSNADSTEQVDLGNYKVNFTANPGATVSYHATLTDAQNNANPLPAIQTITGTSVFYFRFSTSSECANIGKLTLSLETVTVTNATLSACGGLTSPAVFNLTTVTVTAFPGATITYYSDAGLTTPIAVPNAFTATVSTVVYAKVTSPNGCFAVAQITLTVNPVPNINTSTFNGALCDENFDGIVNVNFQNISPQIVNNSAAFNIRYYLVQADATAGNANNLPNNWTYTTATTVYVRVDGLQGNCAPAFGQIQFTVGSKIVLDKQTNDIDICDNNLDGAENVNLNSYLTLFTLNPSVTATFHITLADAQNDVNPLPTTQTITNVHTFYIRFESSTGACPQTGLLKITLKGPKKSDTLVDKTICPGTTTILDAGPGFTSYSWSTGATTQTVTAGVGTYYVDLGFNGCVYRQYVHVYTATAPVITKIDVVGSTASIFATGGTPPYQYSVDGSPFQTSNVFPGLGRGVHTATVISADRCLPVSKDFLVIDLINAITPNGDGLNDVLDYSDLRIKENVSIEIFDRYGAALYRSKKNEFKWDGHVGGRPLSSGSYWYVLKWTEPDNKELKEYSNWILIKNVE